tara:strand:- start:21061 stop:21540 length:480 start_codon:yes stop_codon:yes gene_type:complete
VKELYVIRHAKSGWDHPHLNDFDRQLEDRGLRDAPKVAKSLSLEWPAPEMLLVSPAVRTYQTSQFFRLEWGLPWERFFLCPEIYEANTSTLLEIVNKAASKASRIALVGHNFGVSDLVNHLCGSNIELKTACAARIQTEGDQFLNGCATLAEYRSPKLL